MMTPEKLKEILQAGFAEAEITVVGDGSKFDTRIVDASFEGKRPVARQQAVYALVGDHIASGEMHALGIQAFTPDEWAKQSRFG